MSESEIIEYTNRHKMEETTAKVFARLHQMKTILYKTIKSKYFYLKKKYFSQYNHVFLETSCGTISNHKTSYCSPISYHNEKQSELSENTFIDVSLFFA